MIRPVELVWIGFLACGCATPEPAAMLPPVTVAADCPDVPAMAPVTASAAPTKPTAATKATAAYHGLQASEANAVTAPGASAAYIKSIHVADDLARKALRDLVSQDGHPTPAAIEAARQSIDALVTALETTPGSGPM